LYLGRVAQASYAMMILGVSFMRSAFGVYPDASGRGIPDDPPGHEWGISPLSFSL
jgi:hypothetical protein